MNKLDFELEVAVIIGKKGKNIPANKAHEYIAGLTIMNDFSARTLQWEEMRVKLGPAKGKDFATSLGPELITLTEIQDRCILTDKDCHWDLSMEAYLNNEKVSSGNLQDMHFTFGEIIERCSYGVELNPGEAIGSGTVGTGCLREFNDHKKDADERWLKPGDIIELKVEKLGSLKNEIILNPCDWSLVLRNRLRWKLS